MSLIGHTLGGVELLENINTWSYLEEDLHPFSNHFSLKRLIVNDAPHLRSMSGIQLLREMGELRVVLAPKLDDIGAVGELADSLLELELQGCAGIEAIDELEPLVHRRQLGLNNCGRIESLSPLIGMQQLEVLLAWGSTRIVDGDLSPLMRLPCLQDVRMRDRREYRPRVAEIKAAIAARSMIQARSVQANVADMPQRSSECSARRTQPLQVVGPHLHSRYRLAGG